MTLLLVLPAIVLLVTAALLGIAWFRQSDETYGEAIAIASVIFGGGGIYLLVRAFSPLDWTVSAIIAANIAVGLAVAVGVIVTLIAIRRRAAQPSGRSSADPEVVTRRHPVG